MKIARISTLLSRIISAAKLGFAFYGTSKTRFPRKVSLVGKSLQLRVPEESGCLSDIVDLWLDDDYGLQSMGWKPKTILDIGANVGLFSLWAAHHFRDATVHAYEPNPNAAPFLRANLVYLPVEIFLTGLGSKSGRAAVMDHADPRLASTAICEGGRIVIESLATAINRLNGHVDLMKIDCEGAEWDLMKDRESFSRVRSIRMEYHLINGKTLNDFSNTVAGLGFTIVNLIPNNGFGVAWLERPGDDGRQKSKRRTFSYRSDK